MPHKRASDNVMHVTKIPSSVAKTYDYHIQMNLPFIQHKFLTIVSIVDVIVFVYMTYNLIFQTSNLYRVSCDE